MNLFDINILKTSNVKLLEQLQNDLKQNRPKKIYTLNPEILLDSEKDEDYKQVLQQGDYNVIDGTGLRWGLWVKDLKQKYNNKLLVLLFSLIWLLILLLYPQFYQKRYGSKIMGSKLTKELLVILNSQKGKIFFLWPKFAGDFYNQTSFQKAKEKLEKKYENLRIEYANIFLNENLLNIKKNWELLTKINKFSPDSLVCCLGAPNQEKWIDIFAPHLPDTKLLIWAGASIDFISGFQQRSPQWLIKLNLEWLWRLFVGAPKEVRKNYKIKKKPLKRLQRIWKATGTFIGAVYRRYLLVK